MINLVRCSACGIKTSAERDVCPRCAKPLSGATVVGTVRDKGLGFYGSRSNTTEPDPASPEQGDGDADQSIFDKDISALFPERRRFGAADFLLLAGLVAWVALFSDVKLWLDNGVATFGVASASTGTVRAPTATGDPPATPTDSTVADGDETTGVDDTDADADAGEPASRRSDAPTGPTPSATAALAAGTALFEANDFTGALPHFETAVADSPEDALAVNNLGQTLARLGRQTEALPFLERAVRLEPTTWAYRFNLGHALAELGWWGRAVTEYRQAAVLVPDDFTTQYNLGRALHEWGDYRGAVESYLAAIKQGPGESRLYLSLGKSYEAMERRADAAEAYTRYIGMEPGSPQRDAILDRIGALQAPAQPAEDVS